MGLKQLIKAPARERCYSSTLIDHILASSSEKVVKVGINEISLSDHELSEKSKENNQINAVILHFVL